MKLNVLGTKAVLKESGGIFFPAKAAPWTDAPEKAPEGVKKRNDAFESAVAACKGKSKYKGGTVWGKSEYNKCIAAKLK